jgi:hypothetical protein
VDGVGGSVAVPLREFERTPRTKPAEGGCPSLGVEFAWPPAGKTGPDPSAANRLRKPGAREARGGRQGLTRASAEVKNSGTSLDGPWGEPIRQAGTHPDPSPSGANHPRPGTGVVRHEAGGWCRAARRDLAGEPHTHERYMRRTGRTNETDLPTYDEVIEMLSVRRVRARSAR